MKRIIKIIVTCSCNFRVTIVTMLKNLTIESYKVTSLLHGFITFKSSVAKGLRSKLQGYTVYIETKTHFFIYYYKNSVIFTVFSCFYKKTPNST